MDQGSKTLTWKELIISIILSVQISRIMIISQYNLNVQLEGMVGKEVRNYLNNK